VGNNMINTDIAVVGGGAAGLMAAITAARCGARTAVIEHMDRVGKKILSTGNGKCNYTNALQGVSYYRGEDPAFVLPVFRQFGLEETVQFFRELGVIPKVKNGYYYPASEQASAILEVLRMECDYQNVQIYTSCEIKNVKKCKNGYQIDTNADAFFAKKVIFATGLLAAPKSGSDGSAFLHIEKLGHRFIDIVPALVQLQGKQAFFKALAGIRAESEVHLHVEKTEASPRRASGSLAKARASEHTERGELQLTEYGISGIPVFQLSRFATRGLHEKKRVYAQIDFLPDFTDTELLTLLRDRFSKNARGKCANEALIGLFNKKLIDVLLKESGIGVHTPAARVEKMQLQALCGKIKALRVDITGSKGMEAAQVCAGGVDTGEVCADTLESSIAAGIYFAGEVLDIDGTCGGYNLQWAWSSGYVAGLHAAKQCLARGDREA